MSHPAQFQPTDLPDVVAFCPRLFSDDRGSFAETWNAALWAEAGIDVRFVQDNQAASLRAGTVRGLHFQRPPMAQAKLIRVLAGAIWDVAVDLRRGSPWYGRWVGGELSAANRLQWFIPAGFAHGYVTLTDDTEVLYKVDQPYTPAAEAGLAWDDPALAIAWPLPSSGPVLAPRDQSLPHLADLPPCFDWIPP